ncbi:MAG: hypothetical protein SVG88_01195 [Halobacteriales archaeon]|nr:hypothetical protein [Halobacteriales archaeon]
MEPRFTADTDSTELVVHDPIQQRRYPIETSEPVDPMPVETDRFYFPVDSAVSIDTSSLTLPYVVAVIVRNSAGEMIADAQHYSAESLPDDDYIIELNTPIKLYLRVSSELAIASTTDRMRLGFGDQTEIKIGARSYHDVPATTITTTESSHDMMTAISALSSSLKTTSCERSFPTLRGHPPEIELGSQLSIPDGIDIPETDIRLELPPDLRKLYAASPLAYYLGTNIVPSSEPLLTTDNSVLRTLPRSQHDFEIAIQRLLRLIFFLDCLTRTEGYYQVDLHEREVIDSRLDIDFEWLYQQPLSIQLETYLSLPLDQLEDQFPAWRLVTDTKPTPSNIEYLPFVLNELSFVRTSRATQAREPSISERTSIESFVRDNRNKHRTDGGSRLLRTSSNSGMPPSDSSIEDQPLVRLPESDALEHAWVGEGRPIGANKLVKQGFYNKFEQQFDESEIDITVVCNDPEMIAEYDDDLYGDRDELLFDVTVLKNLSTESLRNVIKKDNDFLHYIGHVERGEFVCADGSLDISDIDETGVNAFLLNGCQSYTQGIRMVNIGSVGGIVTLNNVGNDGAVEIGKVIAKLLNSGFSLRSALEIAREQRIVGDQYIVVGDGGTDVVQNESMVPYIQHIQRTDDESYQLEIITYPSVEQGMGMLFIPYIDGVTNQFLNPGSLDTFEINKQELIDFLQLEQLPVFFENELLWSTSLANELRSRNSSATTGSNSSSLTENEE